MAYNRMTPNHREIIAAVDSITGKQVYPTATNNKLDVNATASLAGSSIPITGATTAVGVAIVDGSGNQITSFGGGTQYQELVTTSPATGTLAMGRYQTSFPTLTNGQMNEPMLDSSSRLIMGASSATIGAISNTSFAVTQSGAWNVGSSSATGSAVPANAFYIGINNGGNLSSPLTTADSGDAVGTTSSAILFRTAAEGYNFNGTTWDRQRSANAISGNPGTGLLGAGLMVFDGTNWQRQTVNSTTTTSKFGADTNILSILGTAPTTAGKLDIKGADGDVFVRQSTASNLNAQVVGNVASASADSGNPIKAGGVYNSSLPSLSSGNRGDLQINKNGQLYVLQRSDTATLTNVSTSTSNATLLSANTARKGAQIYNDATTSLYVKFGATASSTSFTVLLNAAAYYEVPAGYTGQIDAILASSTGTARVTEDT